MCEGEKEREKRGRGRVWIEARSEGESKCEKDGEKGQTERDGGVERVSCQDDASGFVGTSKKLSSYTDP